MTDFGESSVTAGLPADLPDRGESGTQTGVETATDTTVKVWLFGALAALGAERPMTLALPVGATAGDVVDLVGERLGQPFLDQVVAEPGELFRCCRFFANGHPVESLSEPLATGNAAVEIEMLLLMGYEGG